jgi:nickel transport protein
MECGAQKPFSGENIKKWRSNMKKAIVLALILTLVSATGLYAHDPFIEKQGDEFVVLYGHPDKGKFEAYKIEFLKDVKAYDKTGKAVPTEIKPHTQGAAISGEKAPAVIILVFDRGCMVKTPEGYKNVSKRDAKDVIESFKGAKYNKNIWQWNDRFSKPLGGKMELVPLKNPLALKAGDKLPFQVLYDGKPLAGATVAAEGVEKDALKTDPNGRAEIVIKKSGLNIVKANIKTPTPNDPDADALIETANIAFMVK